MQTFLAHSAPFHTQETILRAVKWTLSISLKIRFKHEGSPEYKRLRQPRIDNWRSNEAFVKSFLRGVNPMVSYSNSLLKLSYTSSTQSTPLSIPLSLLRWCAWFVVQTRLRRSSKICHFWLTDRGRLLEACWQLGGDASNVSQPQNHRGRTCDFQELE